jgi:hypothetical protein
VTADVFGVEALLFSGTLTEELDGEGVASPEQGTYSESASEKVAKPITSR